MWPFSKKKQVEERSIGSGFTSELIAARQAYFSGARGLAETTATVEAAAGLWERAFASGQPSSSTDIITPQFLGMLGRGLAIRGQAVFLIDSSGSQIEMIPAVDWSLSTRRGRPSAYKLTIPEISGGFEVTALADEVIDVRINVDPGQPWFGVSPLRKANLTADMLAAIEQGLNDVMGGSWGSMILPSPDISTEARDAISDYIKDRRGGLAVIKSTRVHSAGAQPPRNDWAPEQISPNISGMGLDSHWESARNAILAAFGLPALIFGKDSQSAALREGQRHAVLWTLAPIAKIAAAEIGAKLDEPDFALDLQTPLQAGDAAGRARALKALVEVGVGLDSALSIVGWSDAPT